jgi:putative transposase
VKEDHLRSGRKKSQKFSPPRHETYVEHYNTIRLNAAVGYVTPKDILAGRQQEIQADRDRKLEAAREHRKNRAQRAA